MARCCDAKITPQSRGGATARVRVRTRARARARVRVRVRVGVGGKVRARVRVRVLVRVRVRGWVRPRRTAAGARPPILSANPMPHPFPDLETDPS